MGEQVDQVCQSCNEPVRPADRWANVNRQVFHERCFKCTKCTKTMTMHTYAENPEHKLLCTGCQYGGVRAAKPYASVYGPAPGVPAKATGGGGMSRCARCDAGNAVFAPAMPKGNMYCSKCFVCRNCLTAIDKSQCLELLDELYCSDCEVVYANRRYLLAKMGSGPVLPL